MIIQYYFKKRGLKYKDMSKKILYLVTIFVAMLSLSGICLADQFCNSQGCVEFPGGVSYFADAVVSYNVGTGGVTDPYKITSSALGAPDYDGVVSHAGYVSLGSGGSIVLQFTNNSLTGSGNSNLDLWIFEVGPDGHLKIPHLWPGQNPPPQDRQNGGLFRCFSFLKQVF